MSEIAFDWVELPVGPQPLPEWLLGATVRWNEGYANAPDLWLMADRPLRDWPGQSFVREGGALVARHPDGRIHQWGFQGEFVETEQTRYVAGQAERFIIPATPPSEGCGGWAVDCLMAEGPYAGRHVRIRGPWGIGQPDGYIDVCHTVRTPAIICGAPSHKEEIGLAGLGITHDLFLRVVARFLPHCRVARILRLGWRDRLEIVDGSWDEPKTVRLNRPRAPSSRPQAAE
ncbi:hypothetical protein HNR00_003531 [Methylorubrum rhodinum]|uniref:Uncharacterized protein n=1 Tax=Methylorubrum rhodinum TaxID=29428 RepID=A0A840ZNR3_9HYPH|nr:hypothetical protein [Methylorubrum rhodinum]MBB5758804.1 hypothetical protein [Methylorubrum rhodinum]